VKTPPLHYWPFTDDIVAKRFLPLERRMVFSPDGRMENFDSQNRPFGFYYCRISLVGRPQGDFCNKIRHKRTCPP
jgi:hypothetical protein